MQQQQEDPEKEQGIGYQKTVDLLLDFKARHRAEASLERLARMLLRALERRGLTVDAASRERVMKCEDTDQLEQWFDRAVVARRLDEVFA